MSNNLKLWMLGELLLSLRLPAGWLITILAIWCTCSSNATARIHCSVRQLRIRKYVQTRLQRSNFLAAKVIVSVHSRHRNRPWHLAYVSRRHTSTWLCKVLTQKRTATLPTSFLQVRCLRFSAGPHDCLSVLNRSSSSCLWRRSLSSTNHMGPSELQSPGRRCSTKLDVAPSI